jgi:hypothetical protein
MSKIKFTIILLVLVFNLNAFNLLFRVQIGTFAKGETPQEVSEIQGVTTYSLPEGYNSYFAGGYYENYMGCKIRLASVKKIGIKNSMIRVFKNGKLLGIEEGQEYIAKEEEKIAKGKIDEETLYLEFYNIDKKNTLKNRDLLYREIGVEVIPDSILIEIRMEALERASANKKTKEQKVFLTEKEKNEDKIKIVKPKVVDNPVDEKEVEKLLQKEDDVKPLPKNIYTLDKKKELENKRKEEEQKKIEERNSEILEKEVLADIEIADEIAKEILQQSEEIIEKKEPDFTPTDLPFYKIYLLSNLNNGIVPQKVEDLQEIVYVYDKQKILIYTVGYYASLEDAQKDIPKYQKKGFDKADVIGIYKAMVISKEVAEYVTKKSLGKK